MKYCSKCKKEKPLDEFNKDKSRKDGYFIFCRECSKKIKIKSYHREENEKIEEAEKIVGGYKISILNHASKKEKIYNIINTDGNYYGTNKKEDFFNYLRGILNDR